MNQLKPTTFQEQQLDDAAFQVVLRGVQPNVLPSEARAKLAVLFKVTVEQIDRLLAVPGFVVKKSIRFDIASQYKRAIEAAGGICEVVAEEAPDLEFDFGSNEFLHGKNTSPPPIKIRPQVDRPREPSLENLY